MSAQLQPAARLVDDARSASPRRLERARPLRDRRGSAARDLGPSGGEPLTLERKLAGVWEGVLVAGSSECPMCCGTIRQAGPQAACSACGSRVD